METFEVVIGAAQIVSAIVIFVLFLVGGVFGIPVPRESHVLLGSILIVAAIIWGIAALTPPLTLLRVLYGVISLFWMFLGVSYVVDKDVS